MPSFDAKEALLSGFQNEPAPRWTDTKLSLLNRKRYNHGAVVLRGNNVLVVGGYEEENSTLRSVEVYDGKKWNKKWPKLLQWRAEHATVMCNKKIYVFGGCSTEGCLDSIECLSSSKWVMLDAKLSSKKRGCTAVAVGSLIYIIGGRTDGSYLDSVDVFDTVTNKVYTGPSLATRRFGSASAVVGRTIYVVGGQDGSGKALDTIEFLVGDGTASWQLCPVKLSTPRMYPAVAAVSHCLVVVGGRNENQGDLASVQVVDTMRHVVWNLSSLRQARYACAAVTLRNSRVMVIGGYSSITGVYNSMEVLNLVPLPIQTQIAVVERELKQFRRGSLFGGKEVQEFLSQGLLTGSQRTSRFTLDEQDSWQSDDSSDSRKNFQSMIMDEFTQRNILKNSGQAQVYKGVMEAKDGSKQTVAIKVFKRKSDWDDCKQELMTLLKISGHPNVMEVWDFYEVPMPAFVMRFVAGGDLRDHLDKKGKFTGKHATRVLQGIAQGLVHLHSNGIVHRDLKSLNILLERKDKTLVPVVIDLGLGKAMDPTSATGEFQTNGYMGTANWMAPEMASKAKWSTKTDMFALGVIMWEVLTGAWPYPGMKFEEVLIYVVRENGRPDYGDQMKKAKVSKAHQNLIESLWHNDPSKRPSAEEFLVQIEK